MRIGIITYHISHNYGAVLQSYALQEHLNRSGFDAKLIDYRAKRILIQYGLYSYSPLGNISLIRKLFRSAYNFYNLFLIPLKLLRRKGFIDFINERYALASISKEEIYDDKFDAYILGSDQIWNFNINKSDYLYLGHFRCSENALTISYAASAGRGEDILCDDDVAIECINKLSAISVRESTLKEKLVNKIKKDIEVVVDPTLLVNRDVFDRIALKPKIKHNYVLAYKMLESKNLNRIADFVAKEKSMHVVEVLSRVSLQPLLNMKRNKMFESPEQFLGWFQSASCVVTTSFHGVAFSIVFRKSFYFVSSGDVAENRINSLLEQLGLSDRVISEESMPEFTPIDYSAPINGGASVEEKLANLQQESRDFLANALKLKN